MLCLDRTACCDIAAAKRHLGTGDGGTYRLSHNGHLLWEIGIGFETETRAHVPFHDEVVWENAGVVAIGGGDRVYLLDIHTGDLRREVEVPSLFGHLTLADGANEQLLLTLGWTDVHAIKRDLSTRWVARDCAVDGLTFERASHGDTFIVRAEMDPPGGWFEVTLDARNGNELARNPAFSPDYAGWYRSAKQ